MPGRDKSEIIRALFAAYLSNDRRAVENALADDFHFTSPDDRIDKPPISRAAGATRAGSSAMSSKKSLFRATRPL